MGQYQVLSRAVIAFREIYHLWQMSFAIETGHAELVRGEIFQVTEHPDVIQTHFATFRVPQNLRTARFNTYVTPISISTANTRGAIGLLQELSAYYYGTQILIEIVPYVEEVVRRVGFGIEPQHISRGLVQQIVSSVGSSVTAFYEFTFWTLEYLLYLQENHIELYHSFMNHHIYTSTFIYFHDLYRDLLYTQWVPVLRNLEDLLSSENMIVRLIRDDGLVDFYIESPSIRMTGSLACTDSLILKEHLSQPRYQSMLNEIRQASLRTPSPTEVTTVPMPLINGTLHNISIGDHWEKVHTNNQSFDGINAGSDDAWIFYGSYEEFVAVHFDHGIVSFVYTNIIDDIDYEGFGTLKDEGNIVGLWIGEMPHQNPEDLAQLMAALTNAFRATHDTLPLEWNDYLTQAATMHVYNMIEQDFIGHICPDGLGHQERAQAVGYQSIFVGENIAVDWETIFDTLQALIDSPSHQINLLRPEFTEVGIYWGPQNNLVVQVFGGN